MKLLTADMSYEDLESGGVQIEEGLRLVPMTLFLIAFVTSALEVLRKGKAGIEEWVRVVLRARHRLRFVRDDLKRDLSGFKDALDNDRTGGHAARFVFPKGQNYVTRPQGVKLLERAEQVLKASEHPSLTGAEATRAQWIPLLRQKIDAYRAALEARDAANQGLKEAREEGNSCRRAFVLEIEKVAGHLRVVLAGDPRLRKMIWLRVEKRRSRPAVVDQLLLEEEGEDVDDSSEESAIGVPLAFPPESPAVVTATSPPLGHSAPSNGQPSR